MQQASTDLQQKLSWPVSQLGYPLDLALDAITAAETFRSKRFRDAAMEWMTIFEASRMQVGMPSPMPVNVTQTEDSPQAILSKQLLESGIDRRADAIRTRIAILDATERLDQTGLARVDELISKQSTPALQQIQKYAFGAGDDFCDLPEFADATVKAACEDEPNFERSAKQFLYLEAEAELLRGFDFNAERFFRLYDRDIKENGDWDTRWTGIDPRVVTLKEAQAEMLLRKSGAKTDGEITSDADVYKMQWALEKFVNITRMFSPADDVVRFRRIATRALLIDTRIKTYNQKRGTEPFTQFDQAMTYFRILLPQLNPFPAD